jgi:hypothetical protein
LILDVNPLAKGLNAMTAKREGYPPARGRGSV